jgi:hypothetical protein
MEHAALAFGFRDQATSTLSGMNCGRPDGIAWVSTIEKGEPVGVPMQAGRTVRVLAQGGGLRVMFNYGGWPGRSTEFGASLAWLAMPATAAAIAYLVVRLGIAHRRRRVTSWRVRTRCCVLCGYQLGPGDRVPMA